MNTDYKNKDKLAFYDRAIISKMNFIEDRIAGCFEKKYPLLTSEFYLALDSKNIGTLKFINNQLGKIADKVAQND